MQHPSSGSPPPPDQNAPGTAAAPGSTPPAESPVRRGAWSTEEIAERNRQALMPQAPPGRAKPKATTPPFPPPPPPTGQPIALPPGAPAAPPPELGQSQRRSSHGTTPRAERRRYLTHGKTEEQEPPLETPVPRAAFFAFVCGLCTVVLSGRLSPMTIALAVVAASLAGWMVFQAARYRRLAGLPWAVVGADMIVY